MTLVADINDIYRVLRCWAAVGNGVGLSEDYARKCRNPKRAKNVTKATRDRVRKAHEFYCPLPLPDLYRLARTRLNREKAAPGSPELQECLIELDLWLGSFVPLHPWHAASHEYLRGLVELTKAVQSKKKDSWFGGRKGWTAALANAQVCFTRGLEITTGSYDTLSEFERDQILKLRPLLELNRVAALMHEAHLGTPEEQTRIYEALRKECVVEKFRDYLDKNPEFWRVAWSGLCVASVQRADDRTLLYFYKALVACDSGFRSLEYAPGEVPAINKEPELKFFVERHTSLIKSLDQEKEEENDE